MKNAESTASLPVHGCTLTPLDHQVCSELVKWLLGGMAPENAEGLKWALAHCDDGVTWGRWEARDNRWVTGDDKIRQDISPKIRLAALQELRLFGPTREILIWRRDGGLFGRILDDGTKPDGPDPLRPRDESILVRGHKVLEQGENGFTLITDGTGSCQVIPLAIGRNEGKGRVARARLDVRHFWRQDPASGAVRVAATRLVTLRTEWNNDPRTRQDRPQQERQAHD